jgi:hypothetical protein
VAAGGRVLVLVGGADRSVWLEAVDPSTGAVTWKVPEGFSEITAGVETTPLAHGGVALALVPSKPDDGSVWLEGVDIATGRVSWRAQSALFVTDAPSTCPQPLGARGFCLVVQTRTSDPVLVAVSPATGIVLATVPNITRQLSTTPGVYQTNDTSPTLVDVRTPGGLQWSKRVTDLFGPNHDPDYGWDFDQYGSIEVGMVAKKEPGNITDLAAPSTVGIARAGGRRLWTDSGAFQCGGQDGLSGTYLCLMTGTATATPNGTMTTSKNASVTLEGFHPATGAITWRLPVRGVADLLLGNVAITDKSHLLVTSQQGRKLILDLHTGTTAAPPSGAVYWCARFNVFKVKAVKGLSPVRVGSSLVTSCDSNRHPVASPTQPPSGLAATVGDIDVWAAPNALMGATQH